MDEGIGREKEMEEEELSMREFLLFYIYTKMKKKKKKWKPNFLWEPKKQPIHQRNCMTLLIRNLHAKLHLAMQHKQLKIHFL